MPANFSDDREFIRSKSEFIKPLRERTDNVHSTKRTLSMHDIKERIKSKVDDAVSRGISNTYIHVKDDEELANMYLQAARSMGIDCKMSVLRGNANASYSKKYTVSMSW